MSCNFKQILALTKGTVKLRDLSDVELQDLPTEFLKEYIKDNVYAEELLNQWHKLPAVIRYDYHIQILLPCFLHMNNPYGKQYDGLILSQKRCPICRRTFTELMTTEVV